MNIKKMISGLVVILFSGIVLAQNNALITEKEAQLPPAKGELKTRGIARGPGVKVLSPDLQATVKGPFDLKIKFEPRGGNKIDPQSVKLAYLKSPMVDLTDRVKQSITDEGINLEKATIPPGEHQIKVTVKDAEGRETNAVITIMVGK